MTENCPACRSTEVALVRKVPDREYGVDFVAGYTSCATCQTVRQTPMPDGAELAAFYPADYHAQTGGGLLNRVRQAMRLKRLAPLMEGHGAVLDYGCGNGAFLVHAADRAPGREYFGFEIAQSREILHLEGGITIVKGDVKDLMDILPPCRLITMNHVIEHLPDPGVTVSELSARLVPGGSLEGQTPAAGSLEQRLFKGYWSGYHAPRHTVVFSQRGLRSFLERLGLCEIQVGGAFNPAGVAVSLAAARHGQSGSSVRREGPAWMLWLGLATILMPGDLVIGPPGIQNFLARKPSE
ncbi:MAG: class I SAM-dependent methyltransferase [Actinomycetota bacterium]